MGNMKKFRPLIFFILLVATLLSTILNISDRNSLNNIYQRTLTQNSYILTINTTQVKDKSSSLDNKIIYKFNKSNELSEYEELASNPALKVIYLQDGTRLQPASEEDRNDLGKYIPKSKENNLWLSYNQAKLPLYENDPGYQAIKKYLFTPEKYIKKITKINENDRIYYIKDVNIENSLTLTLVLKNGKPFTIDSTETIKAVTGRYNKVIKHYLYAYKQNSINKPKNILNYTKISNIPEIKKLKEQQVAEELITSYLDVLENQIASQKFISLEDKVKYINNYLISIRANPENIVYNFKERVLSASIKLEEKYYHLCLGFNDNLTLYSKIECKK